MAGIEIVSEKLFPRLVADRGHAIYQRDMGRHMRAPQTPVRQPITIPMVADIALQFVVMEGEEWEFVMEDDRGAAGEWDDMALITAAFSNLRDQSTESLLLKVVSEGGYRIRTRGAHEASFLLLGNLWPTLVDHLGENCYAAVPTPDTLFVAPAGELASILALQELVRATFYEAPAADLLSKAIYQRWDGEWKLVATAF